MYRQESGVEEIPTQTHPGQRVRSALEPEWLHTCSECLPVPGHWRCHLGPPFPSLPSRTAQITLSLPGFWTALSPIPPSGPTLVWPQVVTAHLLGRDTGHGNVEMWERLAEELLLLTCLGHRPVSRKRQSLPDHNVGSLQHAGGPPQWEGG